MALTAKYKAWCKGCESTIKPGQQITKGTDGRWLHLGCLTPMLVAAGQQPPDRALLTQSPLLQGLLERQQWMKAPPDPDDRPQSKRP